MIQYNCISNHQTYYYQMQTNLSCNLVLFDEIIFCQIHSVVLFCQTHDLIQSAFKYSLYANVWTNTVYILFYLFVLQNAWSNTLCIFYFVKHMIWYSLYLFNQMNIYSLYFIFVFLFLQNLWSNTLCILTFFGTLSHTLIALISCLFCTQHIRCTSYRNWSLILHLTSWNLARKKPYNLNALQTK